MFVNPYGLRPCGPYGAPVELYRNYSINGGATNSNLAAAVSRRFTTEGS